MLVPLKEQLGKANSVEGFLGGGKLWMLEVGLTECAYMALTAKGVGDQGGEGMYLDKKISLGLSSRYPPTPSQVEPFPREGYRRPVTEYGTYMKAHPASSKKKRLRTGFSLLPSELCRGI